MLKPDRWPISTTLQMLKLCHRMEGVQQKLEKELESARLQYSRQMLWEGDYSSEGAGSDGYEGCVE